MRKTVIRDRYWDFGQRIPDQKTDVRGMRFQVDNGRGSVQGSNSRDGIDGRIGEDEMKMIDGVVSIVHTDGVNIEIEHKELVMCKNCKYMTDCFSEVAMTDQYQLTTIFEPIEWCSKGERKEE